MKRKVDFVLTRAAADCPEAGGVIQIGPSAAPTSAIGVQTGAIGDMFELLHLAIRRP
ncbi:MAG: hypothetical protein KDE05_00805 [Parvularculaceae bacterium]|nr:hypothetical protein [Parvularculaceae bacterium]